MTNFRTPTEQERAFLRIVTSGYSELRAQVESCEVADYDPDGYCDVRVLTGPPSPIRDHCNGPSLQTGIQATPIVETILWIDGEGMLDNVEFVSFGEPLDAMYERFISAAVEAKLSYNSHD